MEYKELVEQLRLTYQLNDYSLAQESAGNREIQEECGEAADAIEAQAAEIERLIKERDGYKGTLDSANQTNQAMSRNLAEAVAEIERLKKDLDDAVSDICCLSGGGNPSQCTMIQNEWRDRMSKYEESLYA